MSIPVRARSLAPPWPFDAVIKLPPHKWGVMLVADPFDVTAQKLNMLNGIVPTDYRPGSEDPSIEGVRLFRHWVNGAGERLRQNDDSHFYYMADGVDASCGGLLILGPRSVIITPNGAGINLNSIDYLIEWLDGTTPHLAAIAGTQVWFCLGNPAVNADWTLSKEFGTALATPLNVLVSPQHYPDPVAVSVTNGGAAGSDTGQPTLYSYKVVATGAANPPRSAPSNEVNNNDGVPILSGADFNIITWTAVAGAGGYEIWRTSSAGTPGTTGLIGTVGAGITTFSDTGLAVTTSGPPPGTAFNGNAYYEYKIVATGALSPPTSDPSLIGATNQGAAVLGSVLSNVITWDAVAGALHYEVWRTAISGGSPTTTGKITTVDTNTYTDTGAATVSIAGFPPSPSAAGQIPSSLTVISINGVNRLFAGMQAGAAWYYASGAWTSLNIQGVKWAQIGDVAYRTAPPTSGTTVPGAVWVSNLDPTLASPPLTWTGRGTLSPLLPITNIVPLRTQLLAFTAREMFVIQGHEFTPQGATPDAENGRTAVAWNGKVYARFGSAWYEIELTSTTDAEATSVGLERFVQNKSDIKGYVTASAGHNSWFNYFALYNPDDNTSYLLKLGSWMNPDETNTRRWEFASHIHGAIASFPGRQIKSMLVTTITGNGTTGSPQLLLGLNDGTLRQIVLPLATPFPKSDANCRYLDSGSITLGIDDSGFGANDKSYHRAVLLGTVLNQDQDALLSYALDGSDVFADFDSRFEVNGAALDYPEGAQGKSLQPKLTLATTDSSKSPEITTLILFAQVREMTDSDGNPAFRRKRRLLIQASDWMIKNDGTSNKLLSARTLREAMQQVAAAPSVKLILRDGLERTVSVTGWTEGLIIGPSGQETYAITLDYLESKLANQPEAGGLFDPGWGP